MRDGARITDPDLVDAFRQAAGITPGPDDELRIYVVLTYADESDTRYLEFSQSALATCMHDVMTHLAAGERGAMLISSPVEPKGWRARISALDKA